MLLLLSAAISAFVTVFIAEFGDKTQLVSMTLACRYPPLQVLAGAMTALALVLGLAVGVGGILYTAVPQLPLVLFSGSFFIAAGIIGAVKKTEKAEQCQEEGGFLKALFLVFVAEFGDKTQLATMFLVASLGNAAAVFAGAMLGMFLNHLLAVFVGGRLLSRLDSRLVQLGSSFVFVLIGLFILATAFGLD